MKLLKHKILLDAVLFISLLVSSLSAYNVLAPATSLAASHTATLALVCPANNKFTTHDTSMGCFGSSTKPNVQGLSDDKSKYPNTVAVSQVNFDCSPHAVDMPKIGAAISSVGCSDNKSKAKIAKVTPIPAASGGTRQPVGLDASGSPVAATGGGSSTQTPAPDDSGSGTVTQTADQVAACKLDGTCVTCVDPNDPTKEAPCVSSVDPAAGKGCSTGQCDLVAKYVDPLINLLNVMVGFVVVISIILGGIQYSSAGGDSNKIGKAKDRISKTIIAMIAYLFLWGLLEFLIPGGILNR